jgi:hypothetical protein
MEVSDSTFADLDLERNRRCFLQASFMAMQILTHIRPIADQWIDVGVAKLGCFLHK